MIILSGLKYLTSTIGTGRAIDYDNPGTVARMRSDTYRVLSLVFYPPVNGTIETIWKSLSSDYSDELSDPVNLDPLALRLEYNRLFVGPGELRCPPYESVYSKDRPESDFGMLMSPGVIDVKKRYAEAGLEISKHFSDLPDHVSVELEFMCFLCMKEAESVVAGSNVDLWRTRQIEFLKIHLEPWVQQFTDLILRNTRNAFYRASARCLKVWIGEESVVSKKR